MSVAFIRPPDPVKLPRSGFTVRPMGLLSMMGVLRSIGIPADLIDLHIHPKTDGELIEGLRDKTYRLFAITCTTYNRFSAISIASLLKRSFPDRPVLVGGPHFSKCAEDALKHIPSIDIVVRGEGEGIIKELVPRLLDGGDWRHVAGISFREGSHIRHNPDAKPIQDLDSLPVFTQFERKDYPETLAMHQENGRMIPAMAMETSRGCPNRCLFCSAAIPSYRVRSPESVVDEMETWMELFPEVRAFNFVDLTFTADRDHIKGICEQILSRNLDVMWWGESRADIDPDLLDIMYAAGCRALSVGVESGSPRVLAAIGKNISLEQVYDLAGKCDALGIWLDLFLMFSLPSETRDDMKMTMAMTKQMLKNYRRVLYPGGGGIVTSIHPGAQTEVMARQSGIISHDFSWHEGFYDEKNIDVLCSPYVPIYLENLSRRDLKASVWKSNHWISLKHQGRYARYRHLIRSLFSSGRSFSEKARKVRNYFHAFFDRL
ncbi:B12-binding domain-containing radical SAM protein [Thermodesulfobacteriota bacterium]